MRAGGKWWGCAGGLSRPKNPQIQQNHHPKEGSVIDVRRDTWWTSGVVNLLSSIVGRRAVAGGPMKLQGQRHSDFDQSAEWCQSGQSSAYYRATAARARWLQMQATTPQLKQYLERTIARSEEMAGEANKVARQETERRRQRQHVQ
jgi:hypothetical protein